jgi:hypothetical protein
MNHTSLHKAASAKMTGSAIAKLLATRGGAGLAGATIFDQMAYDVPTSTEDLTKARVLNFLVNTGLVAGGTHMLSKGQAGGAGLIGMAPAKDLALAAIHPVHAAGDYYDKLNAGIPMRRKALAAAGIAGAGLGLAGLGLGAAAVNEARKRRELDAAADNSGRVRITLPTRDPGDAETSVELPVHTHLSDNMLDNLGRDVRRRLRQESKERKMKRDPETNKLIPFHAYQEKYARLVPVASYLSKNATQSGPLKTYTKMPEPGADGRIDPMAMRQHISNEVKAINKQPRIQRTAAGDYDITKNYGQPGRDLAATRAKQQHLQRFGMSKEDAGNLLGRPGALKAFRGHVENARQHEMYNQPHMRNRVVNQAYDAAMNGQQVAWGAGAHGVDQHGIHRQPAQQQAGGFAPGQYAVRASGVAPVAPVVAEAPVSGAPTQDAAVTAQAAKMPVNPYTPQRLAAAAATAVMPQVQGAVGGVRNMLGQAGDWVGALPAPASGGTQAGAGVQAPAPVGVANTTSVPATPTAAAPAASPALDVSSYSPQLQNLYQIAAGGSLADQQAAAIRDEASRRYEQGDRTKWGLRKSLPTHNMHQSLRGLPKEEMDFLIQNVPRWADQEGLARKIHAQVNNPNKRRRPYYGSIDDSLASLMGGDVMTRQAINKQYRLSRPRPSPRRGSRSRARIFERSGGGS